MERKVNVYTLYFMGLFGRNRTIKKDHARIAEVPEDKPLSEAEVRAKAEAEIARIKPKPGVEFRYRVMLSPETVEEQGNGIVIRKFTLYDTTCVLEGSRS